MAGTVTASPRFSMASNEPQKAEGEGAWSRDIIVIGASTGGLAALREVVSNLPRDLPASVFIVFHQPTDARSDLSNILDRASALPVSYAVHGERIEPGRVYVAPVDNHVLLRDDLLVVVRGPRENGHRPAVNPLFRSAAQSFGQRVVAVVLTGALDCGSAGLLMVKARGGLGVAQDPATAACPDMPRNAIETGAVEHVVKLEQIAPLLVSLATTRVESPRMARRNGDAPAPFSFVTCPSCHGSLTERVQGSTLEFACHVGHAFSLRSLYSEQADQVEGALWAAVRALEESTSLAQRLAESSSGSLQARFFDRERTMRHHADTLRTILLQGELPARADVVHHADIDQ
jgi:two-component system, chemotaxis family, protein-glutamate methylesterase/glutaminase